MTGVFATVLLWSIVALSLPPAHSGSTRGGSLTPPDYNTAEGEGNDPGPGNGGSDGTGFPVNGRVPQYLQEIYLNVTQSRGPASYAMANYVNYFQGQAVDGSPCPAVVFPLPEPVPSSRPFSGEIKIYHWLEGSVARSLTSNQMRAAYQVKMCIRTSRTCQFMPETRTLTPEFAGWIDFTVGAEILSLQQQEKKKQKGQLYFELSVYYNGVPLPCYEWPLQFVTDASRGFNFAPLFAVYAHTEDSFLNSMLLNGMKTPEQNLPLLLKLMSQTRSKRSRLPRSATSAPDNGEPNSASPAPPAPTQEATRAPSLEAVPRPQTGAPARSERAGRTCGLNNFTIDRDIVPGWYILSDMNIRHCAGICLNPVHQDKKLSERVILLAKAHECGYLPTNFHYGTCIPSKLLHVWVLMRSLTESRFRFFVAKDLVATECSCVV